jgi:hypothetical protein
LKGLRATESKSLLSLSVRKLTVLVMLLFLLYDNFLYLFNIAVDESVRKVLNFCVSKIRLVIYDMEKCNN